ncbi:hypothetical protein EYF80_053233 [Liparis tanakae]|uniref:Uncharacterized protein n=1 Tax=Liparis tanakae TaxID=230148 RepID=A0A4Z2F627_9TELE|nr:hypothetical protein EYF80_053233 [Liparis tanakae]
MPGDIVQKMDFYLFNILILASVMQNASPWTGRVEASGFIERCVFFDGAGVPVGRTERRSAGRRAGAGTRIPSPPPPHPPCPFTPPPPLLQIAWHGREESGGGGGGGCRECQCSGQTGVSAGLL